MCRAEPANAELTKAALAIAMSLLAACANQAPSPAKAGAGKAAPRIVHSGLRQLINFYSSIAPTCESNGYPQVSLVSPPHHGQVSIERGQNYPNFVSANVRSVCNKNLSPSIQVYYRSVASFQGRDSFMVRVQYPDGGIVMDPFDLEAR
ncbi:MAG TPA: hypothetical protein VGH12_02820 [Steroidobacteraceae bacterium]|jgi:hypothetical protein